MFLRKLEHVPKIFPWLAANLHEALPKFGRKIMHLCQAHPRRQPLHLAVALDEIAVLSANPVVRSGQHRRSKRGSKVGVGSHKRIIEHHVGLLSVIDEGRPEKLGRSPHGKNPRDLVPTLFEHSRALPNNHPTRFCRLSELGPTLDTGSHVHRALELPPCRVRNIRSAHIVPHGTEEANEMLLGPLMPRSRTQPTHEKHAFHPRFDGKVEDMQVAPSVERTYDFCRKNGNGPPLIATFHVLPLLLLLILLLPLLNRI